PIRTYLHQGMQRWVGRLLCRPGMEELLDAPQNRTPRSEQMSDIWDGPVLVSFEGHDSRKFMDAPKGEARLIFSLAVDGFNPYQSKESKANVTCTAIYMVCLNLPPDIRYLPENVYLVGIIPGPTKPSLSQINHFL
ncbi:hypothetical protein OBBRIDRAFT_698061, partial [Obba rivulosa]